MQSKKFPTLEEAETYLQSKGTLEYFGREGRYAEIYVYGLTIGNKKYGLLVHENGYVEVIFERYV